MLKTTTLALAATLLTAGMAVAQDAPARNPDAAIAPFDVATADFAKMAMSSNQFEIQSSQMAETKAEAADVKSFAADMIRDHEKAAADLKAALQTASVQPGEAKLAPKHAAMLKQLEAANGADFQALYIDMQAQAHMEAVALFRTYAGSGKDEAVVTFAKTTLPVLEEHMEHVKMLVKAH